jgi:hypothetical protein
MTASSAFAASRAAIEGAPHAPHMLVMFGFHLLGLGIGMALPTNAGIDNARESRRIKVLLDGGKIHLHLADHFWWVLRPKQWQPLDSCGLSPYSPGGMNAKLKLKSRKAKGEVQHAFQRVGSQYRWQLMPL